MIARAHFQMKTLTLVPSFVLMRYAWVHRAVFMILQQTSKYKEKLGTWEVRFEKKKVGKQERLLTPADIPVDV